MTNTRARYRWQNWINSNEMPRNELLINNGGMTSFAWRRIGHCALWKGTEKQAVP